MTLCDTIVVDTQKQQKDKAYFSALRKHRAFLHPKSPRKDGKDMLVEIRKMGKNVVTRENGSLLQSCDSTAGGVLKKSRKKSKKCLTIGNGFSILTKRSRERAKNW